MGVRKDEDLQSGGKRLKCFTEEDFMDWEQDDQQQRGQYDQSEDEEQRWVFVITTTAHSIIKSHPLLLSLFPMFWSLISPLFMYSADEVLGRNCIMVLQWGLLKSEAQTVASFVIIVLLISQTTGLPTKVYNSRRSPAA